jgi:hypothetical protein
MDVCRFRLTGCSCRRSPTQRLDSKLSDADAVAPKVCETQLPAVTIRTGLPQGWCVRPDAGIYLGNHTPLLVPDQEEDLRTNRLVGVFAGWHRPIQVWKEAAKHGKAVVACQQPQFLTVKF